jgi:hypothetical protein
MNVSRPRRPLLESLELRWLPSGLGVRPAAEVSELAAKARPLALNGTLRGTTSLPPADPGAPLVATKVSGRLARSSVSINGTVSLDLVQTPGSAFDLALGAVRGKKRAALRLHVTISQPDDPLNYTITGGTGFLKGSTGSGTITTVLPQGAPTGPASVPVTLTFASSGR